MPGNRRKSARLGVGIRLRLLACFLAPWAMAAAGCGIWDEFRANDYSFKATFSPGDPLAELANPPRDGGKRARAYGRIKEPSQNKGSERDQEFAILVLTKAAKEDQQAICRLEAIKTLSTFKDPRAVQPLVDAYYAAGGFAAETRSVIRMQAMTALGKAGKDNAEAANLLVRVVQAPPVESGKSSEDEKQQYLDERLTAARALAGFKNYQATEALVSVLRTDRDVALRAAAHESLVAITGNKLPAEAQAWDDLLNSPAESRGRAVAKQEERKINLLPPILQRTSASDKDKPRP
jgi:hypothetical protein